MSETDSSALGVHHAAYRCRDAEETRWFYEDVLGLPLCHAFVERIVPGLQEPEPFMHLFFRLENGGTLAFFDQPSTATREHFEKAHSFDRHIALELPSEEALLAKQRQIGEHGVTALGPVDHGFVKSIYMYDPNGLQVEFTTKTESHDREMYNETERARAQLASWVVETKAEKETRFADTFDKRRTR